MSKQTANEIQELITDDQPGYDMPTARRLARELGGVAINARYKGRGHGGWEIGGWAQPTDRHIVVTSSTTYRRRPYAVLADNLGMVLHANDVAD